MEHPWYVIASCVLLGISTISFWVWKLIYYPALTLGITGGILLLIALFIIINYWVDGGFDR